MDTKTKAFLAQFATDELPSTVKEIRQEAANKLQNMSLPTTRWETWKYTSVRPLLEHHFQQASTSSKPDISPYLIPNLEADLIVFVNGIYQAELSHVEQGEGLSISTFGNLNADQKEIMESHYGKLASLDEDIFTAINTAYAAEGLWVHVAKNFTASKPLHILHLTDSSHPTAVQNRNLFILENSAKLQVIESCHSLNEGASFRNAVTEWVVGANANCEYVKLQVESEQAMGVDRTEIHQGDDSEVRMFTISLGSAWLRNNLHFQLKGKNTTSILNGLYMLDQSQHVDNHTLVDHFEPHCYSDELYKGILNDKSSAAFRGKIHVHQPAQKTNAYQSNRNVLLSDEASINTKPQLEIYADDVKCSHGATTGQIDEEALFYLQARGIPLLEAQKLMVFAFAAETIDKMTIEPVADHIENLIRERF